MKTFRRIRSFLCFVGLAWAVSRQRQQAQTPGVTREAIFARGRARVELLKLAAKLCRDDLTPFWLNLALGMLGAAAAGAGHSALVHKDEDQLTLLRWRRLVERAAVVPELARGVTDSLGEEATDLRSLSRSLSDAITQNVIWLT